MDPTGDDRSLILRNVRYLGGHPSAPSEVDQLDLSFTPNGVGFRRHREELGALPWDRVREISADAETRSARMTVPRVWFFGVFAALIKKRDQHVLLRVADDRGAWLFAVDGIGLDELRAGIRTINARFRG